MDDIQAWLLRTLASVEVVTPFMRSKWGWPIVETFHFAGLSLLIGTIGMFDLRLLGMAKRVPIIALHRLVPWGILGYVVNVISGAMFILTEPDQYLYNPAFHFKMLFMALAGVNVLAFYLTVFRQVEALGPSDDAPRSAKVIAGASLSLWLGVLICGRQLTFYRPTACEFDVTGFLVTIPFLATCVP